MQRPNAIIFDLDGVLTDTSEYHYEGWKRLADDLGIPFTREENDQYLRGISRRESLMYIIRDRHYSENQIQELMDRKNRYYYAMIQKMTPNDLVPGGTRATARDSASWYQNRHRICQQERSHCTRTS